ncbi:MULTISPECIES: hypothetical protein [unclassified Prochlorococcus]|uniref:hypothetical protein n=1 Tax=unclassified Prochlorococcus TaxID=2627481 RepID=UPI0005339B0B|nr:MULTISPECIES: hypothetical protein [unclassified Prochlorococcus]KGG16694.1 hypothetical protein EV06_0536 [Prochlorococcus sp. MIT 0602]KGG18334.1 hypothetical protein EV07_0250 [Prochlorococcus sp. MIT 0603]
MFSVIIGNLSILLGLLILVLPVLITELSRPRDSIWGALTMVLGLILITSKERFNGSPMLAVLFGALIIARLLIEISQFRWQQLTVEEKNNLRTFLRWKNSLNQTLSAFSKLGSIFIDIVMLFKPKPKPSQIGKKWVRPEINNSDKTLESEQLSSLEANIKDESLVVPDKDPTLTSKNIPSDVS